jgi:acylphosphatase
VRNLSDGNVEVVIEGTKEAAQQLIDWCQHGPVQARVEGLTVEWQEASREFSEFKVCR